MKVTATSRSVQGSSASRRLRRAGRVPGIVYGAGKDAVSIELDHNEIFHSLRKEEFHASILNMSLDGKSVNVLLRAVQWHPYKPQVLHVDFQRVAAGETLVVKVPLRFINGENSPAVKLSQAVITQVMTELEISCLPENLPPFIEVDLGAMETGGVFNVDQIVLPEGVTVVPHPNEPNPVVASATMVGGSVKDEAEGAEGDAEE